MILFTCIDLTPCLYRQTEEAQVYNLCNKSEEGWVHVAHLIGKHWVVLYTNSRINLGKHVNPTCSSILASSIYKLIYIYDGMVYLIALHAFGALVQSILFCIVCMEL